MRSTFILCWMISFQACTYEFARKPLDSKRAVHRLAVEPVFSTVRTVVPLNTIWLGFQKQIAQEGSFTLTRPGYSDALIRIHLIQADVFPSGDVIEVSTGEDSKDLDSWPPPKPENFETLTKATQFTQHRTIQLGFKVELVDLKSKKTSFAREYFGQREYRTARDAGRVPLGLQYGHSEEALENAVKEISREIGQRSVSEILALYKRQ